LLGVSTHTIAASGASLAKASGSVDAIRVAFAPRAASKVRSV
jgi:hypothetical protein